MGAINTAFEAFNGFSSTVCCTLLLNMTHLACWWLIEPILAQPRHEHPQLQFNIVFHEGTVDL
ncbi:hypothetical protein [Janthinobacterium sp. 13]|uniref:hypothetical protein n=1 Tax=Janthinobacterium sp. 13 TaxID=2035211 RepID=UPI000C16C4EA|nr:hypothetical protein [Janthinobacterium sp. 13]